MNQVTLETDNGPDIFGICETFLDRSVSDDQLHINNFELFEKINAIHKINLALAYFFTFENH